jgi:transcriptional regulator with XRE-family HTH domain
MPAYAGNSPIECSVFHHLAEEGEPNLAVRQPIDPAWWDHGQAGGTGMRQILAERDIQAVFQFLHQRGWSWAAIAQATDIGEQRIREIASGRRRIESYEVYVRVAVGLDIPRDYLGLGLRPPDLPPAVPGHDAAIEPEPGGANELTESLASESLLEPLNRRSFIRTLQQAGVVASAGELLGEIQYPAAPAVSTADITHLRTIARFLSDWDFSHGGADVRTIVSDEVAHALRLLSMSCPYRLRRQLFSAVGYLAIVGGAVLFDCFEHDLAGRVFAFATECAEEADDWHLRAKALSWRSRQETWRGNLDAGLTYAQLALVRNDRLTATEQAMLHTAAARAAARLGYVQDTLTSVGHADESFSASAPAEDPPWMAYYDRAQHAGDTGHALFDLAVHGQYVEKAQVRLSAAVAGHTDEYARSRAFSGIKLAELTMRMGDPGEAVTIAMAAMADAGSVHSRRLDRLISDLMQASIPRQRIPEVKQLMHTVTQETGGS